MKQQNKVYKIEIIQVKNPEGYEQYKFKDLGYLTLSWGYERDLKTGVFYWHGFITPEQLRSKLGDKQWAKFCNGKREFIIHTNENK